MGPFWPLKSLDPDPSGNSLSIIVSIHVFYALFYGMLIFNHLGRPKEKTKKNKKDDLDPYHTPPTPMIRQKTMNNTTAA